MYRADARQSLVGGPVPGGWPHDIIDSAARLARSVVAGGHRRLVAAIVGIRGRLDRSRGKTDADPRRN